MSLKVSNIYKLRYRYLVGVACLLLAPTLASALPAQISPNSLYISPNPCVIGANGTCAAGLTWEADAAGAENDTEIWVSIDGTTTLKLVGCRPAGITATSSVPWIKSGHAYEFSLYQTAGCPNVQPAGALARVTVTGVANLPAYPPGSIGLNAFDLASDYAGYASGGDGSAKYVNVEMALAQKSMLDAKRVGAKFLRVDMTGYNPQSAGGTPGPLNLWRSDPQAYWADMDKMMQDLDHDGMQIVPDFVLNKTQLPALTGETVSDLIDNPDSASYQLLSAYVTQFIQRYKNDPAIYYYELGNEMNLGADLDAVSLCKQKSGSSSPLCAVAGNYSTNDMIGFMTRFATFIRLQDPAHPIDSGYAMPRSSAEHLRISWLKNGTADFTADTPAQFETYLDEINQGIDIISVHYYPPDASTTLETVKADADLIGKKLYVGEFGQPFPPAQPNPTLPFSEGVLSSIVASRIPYASPWVWEFYQFALDQPSPDDYSLEPGYTDSFDQSLAAANAAIGSAPPADPQPDTTAPIVVVTKPLLGDTVASSSEVYAVASDDTAVAHVDLLIDGTLVSTLTAPPYVFLTGPTVAAGSHQITVRAYDAAGNYTETGITTGGGKVTGTIAATNQIAASSNSGGVGSTNSNSGAGAGGGGGGGGGGIIPIIPPTLPASATSTDESAQISALEAEIQSLTAELATLLAAHHSNGPCIDVPMTLLPGSSGSAVRALQTFLIAQGLLPIDAPTGYFGMLTETALQRWQSVNNIVSSGSPATTGYGAFGPQSRSRMSCSTDI
jgi:hypothetical protein